MKRLLHSFILPVFQFAIFSNGFIALCAVMMCHTSAQLFSLQLPCLFLPFIFVSTLASYSFHWYLTDTSDSVGERGQWNHQHRGVLLGISLISGLLALGLLSQLNLYVAYLLPIVVMTFLYTAPKINTYPFRHLRQVAILKTTYLAIVWVYTTTILPLILDRSAWCPAMTGWVANRFLLIFSICLWFDYRDREQDRRSNWLTVVSRLNQKQVVHLTYFIGASFALTLLFLYRQGFPGLAIASISAPMLLIIATSRYSSRWISDYWFYVYLDGMLILTGTLLTLLD